MATVGCEAPNGFPTGRSELWYGVNWADNTPFWPIYGLISIAIVSVTGMAALLSTNFLPAF